MDRSAPGELEALASMLVGLRAQATTLLVDGPSTALASELASSLPAGARLVVLSGEPEEHLGALGEDLRITVHAQAPESFLHDVAAHRFELVILAGRSPPRSLLGLAASRLAPGGLMLWRADDAIPGGPDALQAAPEGPQLRLARLPSSGLGLALLETAPPPRRRGGRRRSGQERHSS